jgi:hypothetical protein
LNTLCLNLKFMLQKMLIPNILKRSLEPV